MDLLTHREEAAIYRDAYVSTVRAALAGWETRQELASRVGVTREYVQLLLQEGGYRTPGQTTAARIAQALPLPREQREDVLEQMLLSAERRLASTRAARTAATGALPAEVAEQMRAAHWAATYAVEPAQASPHYRVLRDLAEAFLRYGDARRQPLVFVETCMLLHDAQSVLDRPGDAFLHARRASVAMRNLDAGGRAGGFRRGQDRFDHLRVNAPYAEAVTLSTLGLIDQAEDRLREAETLAARNPIAGAFWLPHIYRRQLAILGSKPRFSQYEARELARRAHAACEARRDPLDPQVSLLIDESLARVFLQYGTDSSARKAERLLRPAMDALERVPYLGPIHRVVVLKTYARACRETRRLDDWGHYARQALDTALAAGLDHQERVVRQMHGDAPGFPAASRR